MNKKYDLLGLFLAGVTGIALLTSILLRTFLPRIILPSWDVIAVIGLSLIALVLDHYLTTRTHRVYWLVPIWGFLIFCLFPMGACLLSPLASLTWGVAGGVIFFAVTLLFDSMIERLSDGPVAKLAPILSAFGLYLAAQCLMGMF